MSIEEFLESEEMQYEMIYDEDYDTYVNKQKMPESMFISQYGTKEEYVKSHMDAEFYDEDAGRHFILEAEENAYVVEIDGANIPVVVIKDSKKINDDISIITNDAKSDITISTTNVSVPLDTLIKVQKLTSGEEYDKIVTILDVDDGEIYDLSLFSNSANKNITKIDEGTFEVRIPVSENLKDKNLVAYYVDKDENVEEHEVTIEDGYAVFTTNHFSAYTLAGKKDEEVKEEVKEETKTEDTKSEDTKPADYRPNPDTGRVKITMSFVYLYNM